MGRDADALLMDMAADRFEVAEARIQEARTRQEEVRALFTGKRKGSRGAGAPRSRRVVETSGLRKGARVWGYGYSDIARASGRREGAVRAAVARQKLNPGSLEDVVRYVVESRRSRAVQPKEDERG